MVFIGIDPGINGAISFIENDKAEVFRVPTKNIIKNKKKKKDFDILKMTELLEKYKGKDILVLIELVHSMPGNRKC